MNGILFLTGVAQYSFGHCDTTHRDAGLVSVSMHNVPRRLKLSKS